MHLPITWIARTTPHAIYLFFTKRAGYNQGGKIVGAAWQFVVRQQSNCAAREACGMYDPKRARPHLHNNGIGKG